LTRHFDDPARKEGEMVATYEDAALVVQLVRWGTEMGLEEATHALFADGFDAEVASIDHPSVRKMLLFGETVGTLVKHGILDKELVQDLWWIDGSWGRVGPTARRERQRLGEPSLYENFDALAANAGS
jgi:hypothetical protein